MKVTYYGHSCFLVEVDGKRLLFDPFIKENPLAKNIDTKSIVADYILVSHGHGDHTGDVTSLALQTGALVVSNYEIGNWFEAKGVKKIHRMNTGGHWIFDFGKVKCVNAIHSSSMPDGSYAGNPMGFLIESSILMAYSQPAETILFPRRLHCVYKELSHRS